MEVEFWVGIWKLIMDIMKNLLNNLVNIVFPNLCLACDHHPKALPSMYCTDCHFHIPLTDHFTQKENTVTKHFYGRVQLAHGAALYYMPEQSVVQQLIHKLKYEDRTEIGEKLGEVIGHEILSSPYFPAIDVIVSVPLSIKKQRQRGYNQCHYIAKGINEVLNVNLPKNLVIKTKETPSQTGFTRMERVNNVAGVFKITDPSQIANKHVLVVDDVVTTGATVESLCQCLLDSQVSTVSLVCIGAATS
jgi:ComF family protein